MKRMMKRVLPLMMGLVVSFGFAACMNDDEFDDPNSYCIYLEDVRFPIMATADGQDLLSPENEENFEFIKQIKVTYNDMDYLVDRIIPAEQQASRADSQPNFGGLELKTLEYVEGQPYALVFGHFSGWRDYDGLTLVVTWPDGKQDEMKFWRTIEQTSKRGPESIKVTDKILLNGVETNKPIIHREY